MKQGSFTSERFRALDAWRGVCAVLVVLFHAPTLHIFKDTAGFANLQLCVDFFFVLSGFVVSHAYQARLVSAGDGAGFLRARFRRLWPLHVAVLASFVAFELMKLGYSHVSPGFKIDAAPFSKGHAPLEILTNLLFLQSFGLHPGLSWNGPAWSIAVEFWTSVVFAFVILLIPRTRVWAFLGLGLASAVILAIQSPATVFVSYDWGFFRCLLGFSVGCIVYGLRTELPAPPMPFGLAELATVCCATAFLLITPQGPIHLAAPLVFGAMVYVFSFERGAASRLLTAKVPLALGRWSFAIYMTHTLVFQAVRTIASFADQKLGTHVVAFHNGDKLLAFGSGWEALLVASAIIVLVAVPVGAFFHRFVEKPFSRPSGPSVVYRQRLLKASGQAFGGDRVAA